MAMDFLGLSVGMGYTDETVIGGGALKGKNCVISNIEEVADGINVTFQSILDDGTVKTDTAFIPRGTQGEAGVAGKSAYEIWLEAGNAGTEEDFLISLVGEKGDDGKSAYQYAQDGGYIGTETEFTTNIARSGVISKELEVERARIDNLTTLQDGSTTGDAELIDIRIGADGTTYESAGESVRNQIKQVSNTIDDLVHKHIQYLNETDKITGGFYKDDLKFYESVSSNASVFPPIKITKGVTYYYNDLYAFYCFIKYDNSDTVIRMSDNTHIFIDGNFTAEENGYIYITVSNYNDEYIFTNSLEIYENNSKDSYYIPNKLLIDSGETIVKTVGVGKDYTSIRQALESCNDSSPYKKYIVEWYSDGLEYDIASDLTSTELSIESSYIGVQIPAYTKLIGMNHYTKNVIKLSLDENLDDIIKTRLSTLNILGNGEIENITVIGENCKYAVHDDYGNGYEDTEKTIKNCHFISRNTIYHRAYGSGYRSGMIWNFINCVFDLEEDSSYTPFSAHNNVGFTKPANLIFKNCVFNNASTVVNDGCLFGSINTDSDVINNIEFYGCKIGGVVCREENAVVFGSGLKTAITGYGNDINNSNITMWSTDGVDYSYLNTLR